MRRLSVLSIGFGIAALAWAPAAFAQTLPHHVPHPMTTGEVHRYEMERLRARADAAEALARLQSTDTRLTLMELEARRQAAPVPQTLRSPEQERALREVAATRNRALVEGVGQIDAWLDRGLDRGLDQRPDQGPQ